MRILVGYTGFVGSNIYAKGQFDAVFNSKNITQSYGLQPDLLIYAGLRAEKYLANTAPEKDYSQILEAQENIRRIDPKKLVLISTIDVFKNPNGADERTPIDTENLHPYGYNRYLLEQWVRENYPDALIVRLPGLFGINLKKNFIYDYINVVPFMLKQEKMEELCQKNAELPNYYTLQSNGFYKLNAITPEEKKLLQRTFRELEFTALNFTDSRSRYQFYPLSRLWEDIQTALRQELRLWHPATEPVEAGELYRYLSGKTFVNELKGQPADYDYRTLHAACFGGQGGYIAGKETVLQEIKAFVEGSGAL